MAGVIAARRSPWDSKVLGRNVARIEYLVTTGSKFERLELASRLVRELVRALRDTHVDYATVRLHASQIAELHALQDHGFRTVDGILTFARRPDAAGSRRRDVHSDVAVRLATRADAPRLAALAASSYVFDRFHADPAIPYDVADALHAEWAENSCNGAAADAVWIAEDHGAMLGFVTCRLQADARDVFGCPLGVIPLVATSREARGRGIATRLTEAALGWFAQQDVALVEVGTQSSNLPAARLYASCGFAPISSFVSSRLLVGNGRDDPMSR